MHALRGFSIAPSTSRTCVRSGPIDIQIYRALKDDWDSLWRLRGLLTDFMRGTKLESESSTVIILIGFGVIDENGSSSSVGIL